MATTRIRKEATKLLYVFILLSLLTSNLGPVSVASAQGDSATIPILTATNTNTQVVDTPINTENEILQSNSTYIDPQGIFYFEYPLEWSMEEEQRNDDKPETFDLDVTLTTEDNGMILLHMWRNVEPSGLSLISEKYLYPILSSTTEKEYYQGLIQDNELLIAIENDTAHLYPTSVYAIFECNNSVFMFQYIAADSGINREAFKNLLSSFSCKDHLDAINEIPLFLAEEFVSLDVNSLSNDSCAGHWDPTGNTYTCGQCTWWASYSRPDIPNSWGNAETWDNKAEIEWGRDWISENPEPGSIAVWDPYALPGMGAAGHVAYVTWVYNDSSFLVTEMNADNKGSLHSYKHTNSSKVHFILAGVTLYSNKNFDGELTRLRASIPNLLIWGNEVSSIFIPAGWDTLFFKNSNYVPFSYRHRWGGTDLDALESSFWDLSLDYFSDSSIMDHNIRSIIVSHTSCLLDPSMSSVQGELLNPIESESTCSAPIPPPSPNPEPPPGTSDSATFISDITLPDGTVVSPGQSYTKTWRVKNTGTTTWGSGYQLVFTGGEQMGTPNAVNVPVTAPGQVADISVNITAPSGGGSHRGNWRLRNPQGTYFGDELWVEIKLQDGSNPPPPPSDFTLSCLNCLASISPGQSFRPTIRATIGSGQLLGSRGDMLRNTDGNLYGAWPQVAVVGTVNQGRTYDFTFYADNPITAPTSEGTYQTKWRLWQDGRYVGPEYTIELKVQSGGGGANHPPNAPSLTGPGDWAVYYGNTGINLQAQNNGDPDGDAITHYYFEIFESHDIPNSGWITSNSWSPQGLGWNGYQWHVKVRDSRGAESGWSNTWHFNLINNEPEIYDFHSETCRDPWGGSEKICFCAKTNAGTLQLQVNMATDGSGNGEWRVLNELGVPNYSCNTDNDRPPNWGQLEGESGTHLVRLYARREGGWEKAATRDITVYLPPERRPNNPTLLQPPDQSYVNALAIHFDWTETPRTTGYHLEVSNNSNFGTFLVDRQFAVGTTEYDYTFTTDYETVYWRVTAIGPYGTNTATNHFHVDIVPPTSAVAALPPVTTETKFSVSWGGSDARSGLRWYHVQVRDGDRPDSEWVDWLVNTTKTAELFSGQPGHTYFFRVRAMDKVGNWENWPTGDGDTFTLVDPSAAPPTAWWNNAYAAKRNLIILNNDDDEILVHYSMHVHFDSSTTPTAAEIYNASLSSIKGDDVRIVYDNQTELDRFVQRFTSSQIDLWFPLYAVLGGEQTDNSSYQIYYGYAGATSPTVNINDIFLPVADANTIGLWHFQDGAGSTVTDTSGRGHNGTFYSPGWNDGLLGWAGAFDGSSSYVNAGNSNDFNLGSGPMTIEAWISMTQDNRDYPFIVAKWDNSGNGSYFVRLNNENRVHWYLRGGGNYELTVPGGNEILVNNWYHVAVTFDGNKTMRIFINGSEKATATNKGGALNSSDPLTIGWVPGVNLSKFPGYIQHVRISNVERTNFEYANITNAPSIAVGATITPPIPGSPDLVVLDLISYPNPDGGVLMQATIQNQGSANTLNGFYTDLYVDHLPTGTGDYTGSLRFWVNDPIAAGATVTLTTVINDSSSLNVMAAHSLAPGSESSATLYAQTDSAGAVSEPNESDNIYSTGTEICLATADAYEGDDAAGTASVISLGQTQTHNFNYMGDQDWIKFTAQEGKTYTLSTSNLGASADTYLYLYDTNSMTLLASNDDFEGTLASQIVWQAPADGTYYVLINDWNPNIGGCGTSYNFILSTPITSRIFLPLIMR